MEGDLTGLEVVEGEVPVPLEHTKLSLFFYFFIIILLFYFLLCKAEKACISTIPS